MSRILSPLLAALVATVACLLAAGAPAQGKEPFMVPIPDKLERATVKDEAGLLQWAPFEAARCLTCKGREVTECQHCLRMEGGEEKGCMECKGTREAKCRICAGTGTTYDILEKAACPSCFGASFTSCSVCGGRGAMPVQGGGAKPQKCGCCKGAGGWPCLTCKGERLVETPKLRPSLAEASLDDLEKAQKLLAELATQLETFATQGDSRKDSKAYADMLKPLVRTFPPLKRAQKHFDNVGKGLAKGAVWTAYRDMLGNNVNGAKHALGYWLKQESRVIDLCIARQRANAAAQGAGKDGKDK